MNAGKLYETKTMDQLVALRKQLCNDPKNFAKDGGIYLHNKQTRQKFDAIDLAITFHLKDRREARGETINEAGYSGRQSKK